jgi:hypothetical protein
LLIWIDWPLTLAAWHWASRLVSTSLWASN